MDLVEMSDVGSGCENRNCGLGFDFQEEDCYDQDCQFGLTELVCVTVIYIPLMLFGLLGNILTILVVWLRPYMRSSTYLYLSSMAVSDLLILLLLPLDLYKLWRPRPWLLGDLTCKLTMFLSECCTFCTILHITFLSLERYVAVCWPITAKTMVTRRRTRALIGCLWLGAAVSAAPVLVMVGVEEVKGEDLRLTGWMEEAGWGGGEGEQGALSVGGGERGVAHMIVMEGGAEEVKWRVKEITELVKEKKEEEEEREGENGKEGKLGTLETDGREPGEKTQDTPSEQGGGGGEGRTIRGDRLQQNKMKEDEGGGKMRGVDTDTDRRECRCTDYAVSSGLLAAMMILSNLYFLVPVFILGLVYSLIGRTLWIRQRRSRKDQTHRHTIKMLGVIVLAFVLCWLPFHVGRTIFSLSLGTNTERQETYMDPDLHPYGGVQSDGPADPADTHPQIVSQSAVTLEHTPVEGADETCDIDAETRPDDKSTARQITRHDSSQNSGTRQDDSANAESRQDRNTGTHNSTNTTAPDNTHTHTVATRHVLPPDLYNETHSDTQLYFLYYLSQYFNLVSSVLYYLSAAVNPLLYNLMSTRYRHAVHSLVHANYNTEPRRAHMTLTAQNSTTPV